MIWNSTSGLSAGIAVAVVALLYFLVRKARPPIRLAIYLPSLVLLALLPWTGPLSPLFTRGQIEQAGATLRALVAIWSLLCAHALVETARYALAARSRSREAKLASDLLAVAVYVAALLAIMGLVFGLPVGGLLATSGIVAIIVGLALQSTLSDVFSGMAIGIEAPFAVGDRIEVDDRLEGIVVQSNWRSIRVMLDTGNVAVIPNSVIAKARIVNRSFPTPRQIVKVEMSCAATRSPSAVTELLHEAILLCPDILEQPAPVVRLASLGTRLARYEVIVSVENSSLMASTSDRLLREIHRQLRFSDESIDGHERPPVIDEILGKISLFSGLSPSQISTLAEGVHSFHLAPGDDLFRQGEPDNALYIVGSGVLQINRTAPDGSIKKVGRLGAGNYVGEIALLTGAAHAATITALSPCVIHKLESGHLKPLIEQEPGLASKLEASARAGVLRLDRAAAAQCVPAIPGRGQFLTQIKKFFGFLQA